jgi:TonB family protein
VALTRAAPLLLLLAALPAAAQETPDAGADASPGPDAGTVDGATPPAAPQFEPPHSIGATTVPYPGAAPPQTEPIVVKVKLRVAPDGSVQSVELLTHSQPLFDDAVVAAARTFRFEPGRYGGKPVPVDITFTHTFIPPPPPPAAAEAEKGPPLSSILHGRLVELGTRAPIPGATVAAQIAGRRYTTDSDPHGRFELALPAGTARITVHTLNYKPFLQEETLAPRQALSVLYYVERERYDPYEIVIVGAERREEASRVTLRGRELQQIPGTFGDPFRVIQTLPGVASVSSLLPFPIVRGASPGSTGFLLDGTRVPLLFHLFGGPSVLHPEFIDQVQFYPGGAPVPYGGYTAGVVDGSTRRARKDESLLDFDANLLQTGGLVRHPLSFLDATVTAAARIGYPGLILGLATDQASLSYWDYQLRLDGGSPRNGWTVFAFGARDEIDTASPTVPPNTPNPPLVTALLLGFHRLDLRLNTTTGGLSGTFRLVGGVDQTTSFGSDTTTLVLEPQVRWRWHAGSRLDVAWGAEGYVHDTSQGKVTTASSDAGVNFAQFTQDLSRQYLGAGFAEVIWRPTPRWLIRPGARFDLYYDGTTEQSSVDPRLTVRYRLAQRTLEGVAPDSDESGVWLKGAVGIYHEPPRFVLPLPGFDVMALKYGLLETKQYDVGVEVPLREKTGVTVDAYYNDMDPVVFDLAVNQQMVGNAPNPWLFPLNTMPPVSDAQMAINRLFQPQVGRAYGLEMLIHSEARNGLFGWLAYTLSLSERQRQGEAWAPYDFDRTHLVSLVGGLPLQRNWDLSLRLQYQSGRPATTTYGYNTGRIDPYTRIDVRIDKRAVWKTWLLDFYVDLTNIALLPEEITPGVTIRYVLPTFGLRARL